MLVFPPRPADSSPPLPETARLLEPPSALPPPLAELLDTLSGLVRTSLRGLTGHSLFVWPADALAPSTLVSPPAPLMLPLLLLSLLSL